MVFRVFGGGLDEDRFPDGPSLCSVGAAGRAGCGMKDARERRRELGVLPIRSTHLAPN